MREQAAERRVMSDGAWVAKMKAEEIKWVAACKKMRASAARAHPDDTELQNEMYEALRQQALGYYWRGPPESPI